MSLDDEEDLVLPELPPLDGRLGEEEALGLADEGQALAAVDDGAEEVGLDDRTSEGEPLDAGALLGADADGEEERWTLGSEAAGDSVGVAALEVDGEEYGWTGESEEAADSDWDADLSFGEEEPGLGRDAGEVGLDEEHPPPGRDDDAVSLPPLEPASTDDVGGDALAEDLDLAGDGEIAGGALSFEEEERLGGASLPPSLSANRLRVSYLGPDDDALTSVTVSAPGGPHTRVLAAGERLWALSPSAASVVRLEAVGLEAQDLTSVVLDPRDPQRVAAGTRLGGVVCSDDGGRTFVEANGWRAQRVEGPPSVACTVAVERHAAGTRLWVRTRAGALCRSDDFGRTWSRPLLPTPVADLVAPPGGGVYALCVGRQGPPRVAASADGGARWAMRHVPASLRSGGARELHLAALGEHVVIGSQRDPAGPLLSSDEGESWRRLPDLPAVTALLLVSEPQPVLYAGVFFEGGDRGFVLRQPLGSTPRVILDVAAERSARGIEARGDPEGDNRVAQLVAGQGADVQLLWVATGAGLFRVEVLGAMGRHR